MGGGVGAQQQGRADPVAVDMRRSRLGLGAQDVSVGKEQRRSAEGAGRGRQPAAGRQQRRSGGGEGGEDETDEGSGISGVEETGRGTVKGREEEREERESIKGRKRLLSPSYRQRSFADLSARLKSRGVALEGERGLVGRGGEWGSSGSWRAHAHERGGQGRPLRGRGERVVSLEEDSAEALGGASDTGHAAPSSSSSSSSSMFAPDWEGRGWSRKVAARPAAGKGTPQKASALQFVVQQVANHDGMLELHKLGTLLNQKHPHMKKKVGKLRTFLSKHSSHLRIVTSHDVNGAPSDFILLTGTSLPAKASSSASPSSKGGRCARERAFPGGKASRAGKGRSAKLGAKGLLAQLDARRRGKARRGGEGAYFSRDDPCHVPTWDHWSSSDGEGEGAFAGRAARSRHAAWSSSPKPKTRAEGWNARRRSLQRALHADESCFSDSDLPIGAL